MNMSDGFPSRINDPLYNSRLIKNYVEYLKEFHPEINIDHLLDYAKITRYELEDQGHWFSQRQVDRFHQVLTEQTGDPDISRKVGRFAPLSQASGTLKQYAIGLMSPASAYWVVEKFGSSLSRSVTIKTRRVSSHKIEVTVSYRPDVKEKPYQCDNRLGYLEAIAKVFTNKFAEIEHTECIHHGGLVCRYFVTWEKTPFLISKHIINYSFLIAIISSFAVYVNISVNIAIYIIFLFSIIMLIITSICRNIEKKELIKNIQEQGNVAEELLNEINIRYNNALLIKEVGQETSMVLDVEKITNTVINIMKKHTDFDRGMIMLSNREKTRLFYITGYGYNSEQQGIIKDTELHLDNPESKGVFVVAFKEQKPFLLDDIVEIEEKFSKRSQELIKRMGVKSLICVPIVYEKESLGVLAVDNIRSKRPLTQSDISLLMGVASQTAVSIANAMSFQKLQESEKKYRELVENANSIILRVDTSGRIRFFNEFAQKFFGYSEDEIIGKTVAGTILPRSDLIERRLDKLMRSLREHPDRQRVRESENILRNGERVWIAWTYRPIFGDDGELKEILCIGNDITELKRREEEKRELEDRLRQSQKLEAIGTLAGGIAHDFNNILAAIMGYTELANLEIPDGTKGRHRLKEVLKASSRAKDLVQQILAFTRQSRQEQKPIYITYIVKEAIKLLKATLPATIEIRQDIEPHTGTVMADPTQIHQIVMNLCTNAHHAMQENGGTLEVRLKRVQLNGWDDVLEKDMYTGPYLKLTVSDTGHGMPPEVLNRIFDPYFTTKEKGEGTGLGLAVVHGIVKNYGGTVRVQSEVGKGTAFDVYFPEIEEAAQVQEVVEIEPLPMGRERILFVDDEHPLVEIGVDLLEHLGYEVVGRTSSIEALKLFRAQPDRFNLVITDMTMPNMTGEKLAQELLKIRQDIPIILCTGFSERISDEKAKAIGIREFAMKPLIAPELAKTIRKVLSESKPSWRRGYGLG